MADHHLHGPGNLFNELDNDALCKILEAGQSSRLNPGIIYSDRVKFETSLYIVPSGRLRAVMEDRNGTHILGDIGAEAGKCEG
jgi:NTE family protein